MRGSQAGMVIPASDTSGRCVETFRSVHACPSQDSRCPAKRKKTPALMLPFTSSLEGAHIITRVYSFKGAQIMRQFKKITFAFAIALVVLAAQSARADESNQLMILTFSGPVQVPGVVLPAGTYQFKLAVPDTDRHTVEILSEDGLQSYATLTTIPDERSTPTDEAVVRFKERVAGSPEAIRTIFYPGETTGMEFVYPADAK
jgi:hypothetical protein